jgi:hypothetical protein
MPCELQILEPSSGPAIVLAALLNGEMTLMSGGLEFMEILSMGGRLPRPRSIQRTAPARGARRSRARTRAFYAVRLVQRDRASCGDRAEHATR